MNIRELRIGNIVTRCSYEYLRTVESIFEDRCRLNEGIALTLIEDIHPVKVTIELLLRLGIRETMGKGMYMLMDENCWVSKSSEGWYYHICSSANHPEFPVVSEFQYIHQLQNLVYAICGVDLKIDQK